MSNKSLSRDIDISTMFSDEELEELEAVFNPNPPTTFKISWQHIVNCARHELFPKLATAIKKVVNNPNKAAFNIDEYDLDDASINKMLQYLKNTRNLSDEVIKYLHALIKRAVSFTPINLNNICLVLHPFVSLRCNRHYMPLVTLYYIDFMFSIFSNKHDSR